LTKYAEAGVRTNDGLGGMKCTWRGNHNAIEMGLAEEVVKTLTPHRLRRQGKCQLKVSLHGLDKGRHLDKAASHQRFQAQAADPSKAQKAHPRSVHLVYTHTLLAQVHLQNVIKALRKESGR
jgi:hypothetical protein